MANNLPLRSNVVRALVSVLGFALMAGVALSIYWFVATQRELTDVSSVVLNGEKTVLVGDGRASWRYPALLYLSCVKGQPSRLITSWRMARANIAPPGSYKDWVSLLASQRKPYKSGEFAIKSGYDLSTGRHRQLVVTGPLSAEEVDGVSNTLKQPIGWQHLLCANERCFRFDIADVARAGLRSACSGTS